MCLSTRMKAASARAPIAAEASTWMWSKPCSPPVMMAKLRVAMTRMPSSPPSSGPVAIPMPTTAPHTPIALARRRASG